MNALIIATLCAILTGCDATPQVPPAASIPNVDIPIHQDYHSPEPPKRVLARPEVKSETVQKSIDKAWSTTVQYQNKLMEAGK